MHYDHFRQQAISDSFPLLVLLLLLSFRLVQAGLVGNLIMFQATKRATKSNYKLSIFCSALQQSQYMSERVD